MIDLKSSVEQVGPVVTQIITGTSGVKKTISGIVTRTTTQGQFTKFKTIDGRMVMVNDSNVLTVEVFEE